MATCKKCGAKTSFLSSLCEPCKQEEKELKLLEAKKKEDEAKRLEEERKMRVLETSKENINLIIKATTDEQPLGYLFINRAIQQKGGNGLLGVVVGGALGGIGGAMIGNAVTSGGGNCSGEFGVLVVTPTKLIINSFTAPFNSADGNIASEHLELFLKQLGSKAVNIKMFNILQTQVAPPYEVNTAVRLVSGTTEYSFRKSELLVNNSIFATPTIEDLKKLVVDAGALMTPAQFIEKLLRGENPINDEQFNEIKGDTKYITQLFDAILKHKSRDSIVENFTRLTSAMKDALETKIEKKAASYNATLVILIICTIVLCACIVGSVIGGKNMNTNDDAIALVIWSWILGLASVIVGINRLVNLRRSIWCHNSLKGSS